MISAFHPETEVPTPERCSIVELHNSGEDSACSIARARVEPGITTQLHALQGITERYVILEGEGLVEVDHAPAQRVGYLDVVTIFPGQSQRITNPGPSDLIFLCVCTPRFRPEAYLNLEG